MRLEGIAALTLIGGPPLHVPAGLHVALSPPRAGATNVRVQLTDRTELQCGKPRPGTIAVTFPEAEGVPSRFGRGAVQLNGSPVAAQVVGHRVSVAVPPPTGVICDVIGPGSLTVTFTASAHLRNPMQAGTYRFELSYSGRTNVATARVG